MKLGMLLAAASSVFWTSVLCAVSYYVASDPYVITSTKACYVGVAGIVVSCVLFAVVAGGKVDGEDQY